MAIDPSAYYRLNTPDQRRAALPDLLAAAGRTAICDPRWHAIGTPDVVLLHGEMPVGVVLIVPDVAALDARAQRWRAGAPNLLLTDLTTFIHLAAAEEIAQASDPRGLGDLLAGFDTTQPPRLDALDAIGDRLGALARLLADLLAGALTGEMADADLRDQLEVFNWRLERQQPEDFSAQLAIAITHGLLTARLRHRGERPFRRDDARWSTPPTDPVMREYFAIIGGHALDPRVAWLVEWIGMTLAAVDTGALLDRLKQRAHDDNPLNDYFAHFRAAYEPAVGPRSGLDDTPPAIAAFGARAVDHLLRKRLKYVGGLLDGRAIIATESPDWLYYMLLTTYDALRGAHQSGAWDTFVSDDLLPRLGGPVIRPDMYSAAQCALSLGLSLLGYAFASPQRAALYLSRGNFITRDNSNPLEKLLKTEANKHQASTGRERSVILRDRRADIEENNPTWYRSNHIPLADCAALVTSPGFLDDPDYEQARQEVLAHYSELYLLRLSAAPGFLAADVLLLIGLRRHKGQNPARVYYRALSGGADEQIDWLKTHDLTHADWETLTPRQPTAALLPVTALSRGAEYERGWSLDTIFAQVFPGLDAADYTLHPVGEHPTPVLYRPFDVRYIDDRAAQEGQLAVANTRSRDFHIDIENRTLRWFPHTVGENPALCYAATTSRLLVSLHVPAADLLPGSVHYAPLYVYPENAAAQRDTLFAPGIRGRRPNLDSRLILHIARLLDLTFIPDGRGDMKATFGPEDVFNYVYAVLHSRTYCARYTDLLDAGLPRVPLVRQRKLFRALGRRGRALVKAHTFQQRDGWPPLTGYPVPGDDRVGDEYPRFIELAGERGGRVYLNDDQYVAGVPRQLWNSEMGGYTPLRAWLTARRGPPLTWGELRDFQAIIAALAQANAVIDEIDTLVPTWPVA